MVEKDEKEYKMKTKAKSGVLFWLKIASPYTPFVLLWASWFYVTLFSGQIRVTWQPTPLGALALTYYFWYFWILQIVLLFITLIYFQVDKYSKKYWVRGLDYGNTIGVSKHTRTKKVTVFGKTYRAHNIRGNSIVSKMGFGYVLQEDGTVDDGGWIDVFDGNHGGYFPWELPHKELRDLFYYDVVINGKKIRRYTVPKCNDLTDIFFATKCYNPITKQWDGQLIEHPITKDLRKTEMFLRGIIDKQELELKALRPLVYMMGSQTPQEVKPNSLQ